MHAGSDKEQLQPAGTWWQNSPPAQSKAAMPAGNRMKNARRYDEERQRPAGIG
ncbi:MAG: hypothetical protein ACLR23_06185 [Clostridia bacterium]